MSCPGVENTSNPSQQSLMIGVAHAAASKSRTRGVWPTAIMASRVRFKVNRWPV